jgi:hypothetical protein
MLRGAYIPAGLVMCIVQKEDVIHITRIRLPHGIYKEVLCVFDFRAIIILPVYQQVSKSYPRQ